MNRYGGRSKLYYSRDDEQQLRYPPKKNQQSLRNTIWEKSLRGRRYCTTAILQNQSFERHSRAESNNFYEYFSAYLNKMQHVHPYVCIVYVTVYGVLHYLAASRIAVSIHHPAAAVMSKEYEIFERWSCKNHASRKLQSLNSDFEKKIEGGNRSTKCCAYSVAEWHYSESLHW